MVLKRLFIFVEGEQDERFIKKIIQPLLSDEYYIQIILYANPNKRKQKEYIKKFIRSINKMDAEYIFIRDLNNEESISLRIDKTKKKFPFLHKKKILIVVKEIEGWYLAGLDKPNSKRMGIKFFSNTESIEKEYFHRLKPKEFMLIRDFKIEILKHFNIDVGIEKNASLKYLINLLI